MIKRKACLLAILCGISFAGEASTEATIEYIGHACFVVESSKGTRVLIDPYASRVWIGYAFPDDLVIDAVFISHPHYDHDAGLSMGRTFPWKPDVPVYRDPGSYEIGDIEIVGFKGKHADPYGHEFGQKNTIWLLKVDRLRIAHLGDNGPLTRQNVDELGRIDLLMIPIDAFEHILKNDEIRGIRDAVKPRIVIPMHYRIPFLEPRPDRPRDLGPIDPWLAQEEGVVRLKENKETFTPKSMPSTSTILVFQPSPKMDSPSND